jgi:hypothetical protein
VAAASVWLERGVSLMNSKLIEHIMCVVLGVPQSRTTVTQAIDLALEYQARLTFVHVNNVDFLISAGPILTSLPIVKKQIQGLSKFAMDVLCDRAQRRGVENVDYILLEGRILSQIYTLLSDLLPDLLIIGRPVEAAESPSPLKPTDIETFINEVEGNLNIQVIPVEY